MSKSIFSYTANGNLAKVLSGGVIAGGKGVNEYYLVMDEGNRCEDNWLPTDLVFVVFKRPDGEVSTPQVMSYHSDGYWRITSSGWETDVDIGDTATSLLVSFTMRRYSTVSAGRFVETTPTEMTSIPLYPSNSFTPLEIADNEADAILSAMSDVQDDVGSISNILKAIIDGEQIECGDPSYIDNLTTTQSGIGALDARQGYMLDKKKADLEYVNGELAKKPSTTQLNEKVSKEEFKTLKDKVDGLTGGGGQTQKFVRLNSYKSEPIIMGGEGNDYQICTGIVFNEQIPADRYSAYYVRVFAPLIRNDLTFSNGEHFTAEGIVINDSLITGTDSIGYNTNGQILPRKLPLIYTHSIQSREDTLARVEAVDGNGFFEQVGVVLVSPTTSSGGYSGFDIEVYGNSQYRRHRDEDSVYEKMDLYIEVFGIL